MSRIIYSSLLLVAFYCGTACAEKPRFATHKTELAELCYVGNVPVLQMRGTPEEMGQQEASLVGQQARDLLSYAPKLIKSAGGETAWHAHVVASRELIKNAMEAHQQEIAAFEKTLEISGADIVASQTLYDTLNLLGCSSIIVPGEMSHTHGPLFGRNLDYVTFGFLHQYNLVKVYRPKGKYAFASIGFPGCFGVLSGMNEHGFALALHEVRSSADDSLLFDPTGVPTMLVLRSLLEECTSVAEAEAKLTATKRTTSFNLAVCDVEGGAVFEVTTKHVVLRKNNGVIACTNHFRSAELCRSKDCARYTQLLKEQSGPFDIAAVAQKLHTVNQGNATFQSMIFEPKALKLHVSLHALPSSSGSMSTLELKPLFK